MERLKSRKSFSLLASWVFATFFIFNTGFAAVEFDNINIDTNTISTLDTNGALVLAPNGTGPVRFSGLTATTVPYLDASKNLTSSAVTPTELGYLSGVTSAIQTQINSTATGAALAAHEADTTSIHGIADTANLVTLAGSQTLTNKTLTSPVVNSPTGIVKGDVGLGNVDNTSDATKNAAAVALTNKTVDGDLNTLLDVGISSLKTDAGAASTFISRDGSGVVISTKAVPTGTVVGTSDTQTLSNKELASATVSTTVSLTDQATAQFYEDTAGGTNYAAMQAPAALAGNYTLTLPPTDGTPNQVLYTDGSGALDWVSIGSGDLAVVSKTTTYTATTSDQLILVSTSGGAWTLTLYTAVGNTGKRITIKKTTSDFSALTIDGNGAETVEGAATRKIAMQNDWITLVSDGSNWVVFDKGYDEGPVSFTSTGAWTTNTSYSAVYWRINWHLAHVQVRVSLSGVPDNVTLTGVRVLPTGLSRESANQKSVFSGRIMSYDNGTNYRYGMLIFDGANTVQPIAIEVSGTYTSTAGLTRTVPFTWGNLDTVEIDLIVPVTEWAF
jgi:hypothetical protein